MCKEAPPSAGAASPRPNRASHPCLGSEKPCFGSPPIGSSEELWFLVVLDTASPLLPSCTSAAVILSIVSLKSSTTTAYNGPPCRLYNPPGPRRTLSALFNSPILPSSLGAALGHLLEDTANSLHFKMSQSHALPCIGV